MCVLQNSPAGSHCLSVNTIFSVRISRLILDPQRSFPAAHQSFFLARKVLEPWSFEESYTSMRCYFVPCIICSMTQCSLQDQMEAEHKKSGKSGRQPFIDAMRAEIAAAMEAEDLLKAGYAQFYLSGALHSLDPDSFEVRGPPLSRSAHSCSTIGKHKTISAGRLLHIRKCRSVFAACYEG